MLLLDAPAPNVAAALDHHGYVQIDPINVCGRMHDLILRNRVEGYQEGDLTEYLHQPSRPGFEHYLPGAGILVAFTREAWPHLQPEMHRRRTVAQGYGGKLNPAEGELAKHILSEIGERGPLTSDDITHHGRAITAWGTTGREVKVVLEKLFFHGRVLISRRRTFRRVYDLPERVLPAEVLSTVASEGEATRRWLVLIRLRQRRLTSLRKEDLALVEDAVQPVKVGEMPMLYCLRADAHLLEISRDEPEGMPLLLAPLDPIIYDRRITSRIWDFDYTWEVYTPPEKRVRGYYALPVLSRTTLVGHVDLKADRANRRLETVSRQVRRGHSVAPAVAELAKFLGLRRTASR